MKMEKRLSAILLALCLMIGLFTVSVFAAEECTGCTHLAAIGSTHYDTLQDAVDAAASGDTIRLLANITYTEEDIALLKTETGRCRFANISGKTMTFNMNGREIKLADDVADDVASLYLLTMFNITHDSHITITGGGKITANGDGNNCRIFYVEAAGTDYGASTLVLENVDVSSGSQMFFSNATPTPLQIKGGTYTVTLDAPYSAIDNTCWINSSNGVAGTTVISGGTFVNYDPLCFAKAVSNNTIVLAEGYAMQKVGDVYTVISADSVAATITRTVDTVGRWGNTIQKERVYAYTSAEAAFANAQSDDTITLLASTDLNAILPGFTRNATILKSKDITIDSLPVGNVWAEHDTDTHMLIRAEAAIGDNYYNSLADAIAAANAGEDKTITLLIDCEYDWGDTSGENSKAPNGLTFVGKTGKETLTFKGYGSANPIKNCIFKNLKIKDETKGDTEGSWEHGYLEFDGLTAEDVVFLDPPQLNGNCRLTGCTFTGKTVTGTETFSSGSYSLAMYGAWVNSGSATFEDCTFNGTRGLKAHEAYGSEISGILVDGCTFTTTDKPGVVLGELNADTDITVRSSIFTGCAAGDQGMHVYESDTDVTTLDTFQVCGNTVDGVEQPHAWDDGVVIREPSYTATGLTCYTCINCGATRYETVDKLFPLPALIASGLLEDDVDFADVSTRDYFYKAVSWAVRSGITTGTSRRYFSPDEACTRAQAVTFLWRAAGEPRANGTNPFSDVYVSDYYYEAVLWAVSEGIVKGTSDTTFSPNAACSRAQIVAMFYRAAGEPVGYVDADFTDITSGAYYADAVAWAVAEGITDGTGEKTFSPNATCSRAQIVTFLYRS